MWNIYSEFNWSPSTRELKHFSWAVAAALTLLGALAVLKTGSVTVVPSVLWIAAAAVLCAGTVAPGTLLRLYRCWMAVVLPIAFIVEKLLLTVFFFLVVTPVALFLRLVGRDAMNRGFDRNAESYWITRESQSDPERYYRQY